MVLISPSPHHQWPQNQTEEKGLMEMEKPVGCQELQQQQQQQALKCPRCDSSNTKFCYYNNYSLTQPRHFCKACKRYWTRGGTLRNVPVGGGCRKNKRVIKRPAASSCAAIEASSPSSLAPAVSAANPPAQSQIHLSSNPLFYGLPTNPNSEMNLPFSRFNSRVSDFDTISGYDLNVLGLGFSSGFMSSEAGGDNSNSLLSSYSIFSPTSSTTTTPSMASLLASSCHRQKFINGGGVKDTRADYRFQSFAPFEDLQINNNSEAGIAMNKQVKVEEGQNRMDWINVARQNQIEQFNLSDPSLYWNATNVGAWNDPANLGSSVTSLI